VSQLTFGFPWPFANRDLVVEGYGVDFSENNKILVNTKSVEVSPYCEVPPPSKDVVRAEMMFGGFLIEPKNMDSSKLSFMVNMDVKMVAPSSLINFVASKMVHYILVKIRRTCEFGPGSEYDKRIQANPQVYEYIKHRANEVFSNRANNAAQTPITPSNPPTTLQTTQTPPATPKSPKRPTRDIPVGSQSLKLSQPSGYSTIHKRSQSAAEAKTASELYDG